jgi:hypothetical protein
MNSGEDHIPESPQRVHRSQIPMNFPRKSMKIRPPAVREPPRYIILRPVPIIFAPRAVRRIRIRAPRRQIYIRAPIFYMDWSPPPTLRGHFHRKTRRFHRETSRRERSTPQNYRNLPRNYRNEPRTDVSRTPTDPQRTRRDDTARPRDPYEDGGGGGTTALTLRATNGVASGSP